MQCRRQEFLPLKRSNSVSCFHSILSCRSFIRTIIIPECYEQVTAKARKCVQSNETSIVLGLKLKKFLTRIGHCGCQQIVGFQSICILFVSRPSAAVNFPIRNSNSISSRITIAMTPIDFIGLPVENSFSTAIRNIDTPREIPSHRFPIITSVTLFFRSIFAGPESVLN